jgi:hypothetical protein
MKAKLLQRLNEAAEGTEVKMLESLVKMAESLAENYPAKVSANLLLCTECTHTSFVVHGSPGASSKQSAYTVN